MSKSGQNILYPVSDSYTVDWINESGNNNNIWTSVDEGVFSPNDSDWIETSGVGVISQKVTFKINYSNVKPIQKGLALNKTGAIFYARVAGRDLGDTTLHLKDLWWYDSNIKTIGSGFIPSLVSGVTPPTYVNISGQIKLWTEPINGWAMDETYLHTRWEWMPAVGGGIRITAMEIYNSGEFIGIEDRCHSCGQLSPCPPAPFGFPAFKFHDKFVDVNPLWNTVINASGDPATQFETIRNHLLLKSDSGVPEADYRINFSGIPFMGIPSPGGINNHYVITRCQMYPHRYREFEYGELFLEFQPFVVLPSVFNRIGIEVRHSGMLQSQFGGYPSGTVLSYISVKTRHPAGTGNIINLAPRKLTHFGNGDFLQATAMDAAIAFPLISNANGVVFSLGTMKENCKFSGVVESIFSFVASPVFYSNIKGGVAGRGMNEWDNYCAVVRNSGVIYPSGMV